MDGTKQLWIVCYDVADARRLRQIARIMEGFGQRAQKSVFECWLEPADLIELQHAIAMHLQPQTDSVRYYCVCKTCRNLSEHTGGTPIAPIERFYIV